jgi:hypothetical protein
LSDFSGFFLSARRFMVAVRISFSGALGVSFSARSKRALASTPLFFRRRLCHRMDVPSFTRLPVRSNTAHTRRQHSGQERPSFPLMSRSVVRVQSHGCVLGVTDSSRSAVLEFSGESYEMGNCLIALALSSGRRENFRTRRRGTPCRSTGIKYREVSKVEFEG